VIGDSHVQRSATEFEKLSPKRTDEDWITVGDKVARYSMEFANHV